MRFLVHNGFGHVHIMAHSLGVRVLMASLRTLENNIQTCDVSDQINSDKLPLKIATITLLSPDLELVPFQRDLGHQ